MWMYGKVKKQPILEMVDGFDNFGWQKHFVVARGGRSFAPQLDLLVPIVIEYAYFPEISRLHRLPAHIGALEIAWWCRDWIGIACSWLTCNIWTNWVGTTRRPTFTCGIAPVRLIRTNL